MKLWMIKNSPYVIRRKPTSMHLSKQHFHRFRKFMKIFNSIHIYVYHFNHRILGTRVTELEGKLQSLSADVGLVAPVPDTELAISPHAALSMLEPCHDVSVSADDLAKQSCSCSSSANEVKQSSFTSDKSRTSSVCSDQVHDVDHIINDGKFCSWSRHFLFLGIYFILYLFAVFDDDVNVDGSALPECFGSEVTPPLGSPINRQKNVDDDNDLPPALQKLVNAAMNDMNDESPSKSAVIETSHSETRMLKLCTDSSERKWSSSSDNNPYSVIWYIAAALWYRYLLCVCSVLSPIGSHSN